MRPAPRMRQPGSPAARAFDGWAEATPPADMRCRNVHAGAAIPRLPFLVCGRQVVGLDRVGDVGDDAGHRDVVAAIGADLPAAEHGDDGVAESRRSPRGRWTSSPRHSPARRSTHDPVDVGARADVDAAGRLVHHQHAGWSRDRCSGRRRASAGCRRSTHRPARTAAAGRRRPPARGTAAVARSARRRSTPQLA